MNTSKYLLTIALVAVWALTGCKSQNALSMNSPESTFEALVTTIENRDLETYTSLWHPDRKEKEGMVSRLANDPTQWDELQGIFRGKNKIGDKRMGERDGNKTCKMQIENKEADGGGIGSLMMMEVDGKWLMWTW